jgi:hypothetical protein
MTQVPVPEGLGGTPEHGEQSAAHGAVKGVSAQFTEAGSLPYHHTEVGRLPDDQEQPSSAAGLCLSLLPEQTAGLDRAAVIGAARLTLVGVIAPAATIYIAKAAKWPPALTAAAVGLELALAYLAGRAANRAGMSARADLRGLPA